MTLGEMKTALYTVKDVSRMAGVGIKTLHHYDAIGLLPPHGVSPAGYRLYGRHELERLQQILFYRELGFPLKDINPLIDDSRGRLANLRSQRVLLVKRQQDMSRLIATIDQTIAGIEGGYPMPEHQLFEGFATTKDWNSALADHNTHLKAEYGADIPPVKDANEANASARRAKAFMDAMSAALRDKKAPGHADVRGLVDQHLAWLVEQGHVKDAQGFIAQTQYFIDDDFHRDVMENHQTGLSYFLNAAARAFAG